MNRLDTKMLAELQENFCQLDMELDEPCTNHPNSYVIRGLGWAEMFDTFEECFTWSDGFLKGVDYEQNASSRG